MRKTHSLIFTGILIVSAFVLSGCPGSSGTGAKDVLEEEFLGDAEDLPPQEAEIEVFEDVGLPEADVAPEEEAVILCGKDADCDDDNACTIDTCGENGTCAYTLVN
ncbi:MAG: hypothetical protein FJ088_11080, partial [Deltaproteobacteria bacterium]|nr:hypothetical protein [Deltaproteobacteria bacterium]